MQGVRAKGANSGHMPPSFRSYRRQGCGTFLSSILAFFRSGRSVHELMEARDEKRLLRLQRQLAANKLLIVDELGYVPLSQTGAELLFEVFSQRYERGSTIVTSNLPFDEWTSVFGAERLTGALLDRLTHHVHILEMNGDSYRLAHSKRRSRRPRSDAIQTPHLRIEMRRARGPPISGAFLHVAVMDSCSGPPMQITPALTLRHPDPGYGRGRDEDCSPPPAQILRALLTLAHNLRRLAKLVARSPPPAAPRVA